jgi:hypothetical protein
MTGQHAVSIDFPLQWDRGAPMPHSIWLKELEAINRVHSRYDPAHWRHLNHYVFSFKDSTFECIAKSFKVEVYRESMRTMLGRMVERVVS